jgi:protein-S-isoprenylcysteine O-methyltransferase Ste14
VLEKLNTLVPPPIVTGLCMLATWALHKQMGTEFEWGMRKPIALLILISGLLLMSVATLQFARAKTTVNPMRPARTSSIVSTGIFAVTRNPIYLGDIFVLIAWALWLGSITGLVVVPLFIAYINHFQIKPEEQALLKKFGPAYQGYLAKVRRWV